MRIQSVSNVVSLSGGRRPHTTAGMPDWGDDLPRGDDPADASRTIRLLAADDDDVDREKLRRLLDKLPLQIELEFASTGREALSRIQAGQYDCVVLDYRLGDMEGADVIRRLPEELVQHLPIIVVTGFGDEQTAVSALRLGVYDYLPKRSLNADILRAAIEGALRRAWLQRQLTAAQGRLRRQSLYDELSGLPNRYLFFDRLEHEIANAQRHDSVLGMLMMDLDLFKRVNDELGHEAGDAVLATIGSRLAELSRKSDTMARIGGDEFAAVLPGVGSLEDTLTVVRKLVDAVSDPILVADHIVHVGISVGVVLYPFHGRDARTLYTRADQAMYEAKRNSRSYMVHADDGDDGVSEPAVIQALPHAIEHRELFLEYQPKVDLATGRVSGAEALIRWQSPEMGRIMPDRFIPAAERTSLIRDLTRTSLEMATEQLARWRERGIGLVLAVNLSARMLDDPRVPALIGRLLDEHGLTGRDLTVEITETALASSECHSAEVLSALTDRGVRLSIDDFGTGFTSFRCIRDTQIGEIKIDRLFIQDLERNPKDESIVRAIALLGSNLGVPVVAEGVEQPHQLQQLRELGCTHAQGYCIAPPMPEGDFLAWLDGHPGVLPG